MLRLDPVVDVSHLSGCYIMMNKKEKKLLPNWETLKEFKWDENSVLFFFFVIRMFMKANINLVLRSQRHLLFILKVVIVRFIQLLTFTSIEFFPWKLTTLTMLPKMLSLQYFFLFFYGFYWISREKFSSKNTCNDSNDYKLSNNCYTVNKKKNELFYKVNTQDSEFFSSVCNSINCRTNEYHGKKV